MENIRNTCKKLKGVGAGVEVRLAHHLTKVIGLIPVLSCGAPSTQGRHDTQYNDTSMAYTSTPTSGVENSTQVLSFELKFVNKIPVCVCVCFSLFVCVF